MDYDINILKRQQDELLSRLNSLSVEVPRTVYDDAYSEIERAANKLSDSDRSDLTTDDKYNSLVSELNTYIQQEQFRLIRESINQNPKAVKVMHDIASYIIKFKSDNDCKKADTIKAFEDYMGNYSDMTYSEYLKLKETNR